MKATARAGLFVALLAWPWAARADETLERLERSLSREDTSERVLALRGLSAFASRGLRARSQRALSAALRAPEREVRRAALEAWVRLPSLRHPTPEVLALLEEPELRVETLRALRECEPGEVDVGARVLPYLEDPETRLEALRTLRHRKRSHELSGERLRALLADPEPQVRLETLQVLASWTLPRPWVDPILARFEDPDPRVREGAARLFARFVVGDTNARAGSWRSSSIPSELLHKRSRSDPRPYALALAAPLDATWSTSVVPSLLSLYLGSHDLGPWWRAEEIREHALTRLRRLRADPPAANQVLMEEVHRNYETGDVATRSRLLILLRFRDPRENSCALKVFESSLREPSSALRVAAIRAFGGSCVERQLHHLEQVAPWLRFGRQMQCVYCGDHAALKPSPRVRALLLQATEDEASVVRAAALAGLEGHPGAESTAALLRALGDGDPGVRRLAAVVLAADSTRGKLDPRVAEVLRADPIARGQVFYDWSRRSPPGRAPEGRAFHALCEQVLRADPAPRLRASVVWILGQARDFGAAHRALLRRACDDPSALVRANALEQLGGNPQVQDVLRLAVATREGGDVASVARNTLRRLAKQRGRGALWWAVLAAYGLEAVFGAGGLFLYLVLLRRLPWAPARGRRFLGGLVALAPALLTGSLVHAVAATPWVAVCLPSPTTLLPAAPALALTLGGIVFGLALWACLGRKPVD